ncbi:MAG: NUDIX domain-containing protein [Myxococcota bacterium]
MKGIQLTGDLHVIVVRNGHQVLLMRRFNTGYQDGKYGVPSGHLEPGETPTQGAIRELLEEVGIDADLQALKFRHFMFHESNNARAALFFQLDWDGETSNNEPHKCDELRWVPIDTLPNNMVPYVKAAVENILKNQAYSEFRS